MSAETIIATANKSPRKDPLTTSSSNGLHVFTAHKYIIHCQLHLLKGNVSRLETYKYERSHLKIELKNKKELSFFRLKILYIYIFLIYLILEI